MANELPSDNYKLALAQQDLPKITSPEGCTLNLTDKFSAFNMEDGSYSDDESFCEDNGEMFDKKQRIERLKRDYIALSLNTNKDPGEAQLDSPISKILTQDDDDEPLNNTEDRSFKLLVKRMYQRYDNLNNFEVMIQEHDFKLIDEDNLIYKKQLMPGVGNLASEDSMVIYNCAFWTERTQDPYDSTWLRRETMMTDMSEDSILPGLYQLLLTMKRGEWAEALIRPEAAFGKLGVMPRIPANATIFCLIEVVKIISKQCLSKLTQYLSPDSNTMLSFEEFYKASDVARMRGNFYYREKHFKAAMRRYRSGITILEMSSYKNGDEESMAKELLLKLYNNLAKAANACGEVRVALYACKQAMMIRQDDPKTYWCKMTAWRKKGDLDRALGVANQALHLFKDPSYKKCFGKVVSELREKIDYNQQELNHLHRLMGESLVAV